MSEDAVECQSLNCERDDWPHPAPAVTVDVGFVHVGAHEWKNGAEQEWVCADNCPHPDHDHEDGHIGRTRSVE